VFCPRGYLRPGPGARPPRTARPARHRSLRGGEPRRSLHHGPGDFVQTNILARSPCSKRRVSGGQASTLSTRGVPISARLDRRGIRIPGAHEPPFKENDSFRAEQPLCSFEGRRGPLGAGVPHTYGLPTLTVNCSNKLRPLPVSRKAHSLMILNAITPQTPAGLRRGRQRARLVARAGSLHGDPTGPGTRPRPARATTSAATTRKPISRW